MIGKPKYKLGDIVKFKFDDKIKEGVVAIVDAYGTFANPDDVSYDILVDSENMLYKHFGENTIIKKVGKMPEEDIWIR